MRQIFFVAFAHIVIDKEAIRLTKETARACVCVCVFAKMGQVNRQCNEEFVMEEKNL